MSKELTDKQSQFAREYIIDFNATRAAIRAGYSEASAKSIACDLMAIPNVHDAIEAEMEKRTRRTHVTADRVIKELARVAFSDFRNFAKWDAGGVDLIDSSALSDDDSACVEEVGETISAQGAKSMKLKLHSKIRALELLGKHTGAFNLDDEEKGKDLLIKLAYALDDKESK